VLYGEVLVKPTWTQPSLSQDEIKKNGGVPPPPQPVIPSDFTVQLYNPDQQIVVSEKPGSWGSQPTYTFEMPQYTFRTPSVSALDRQQNDPAADATTPKVRFVWRREGKLSKDLTCFLIGKSTDTQSKKKGGKEPGIVVAIFSAYRNLSIYEPNLHRVEMEDYKGLEIVLLLSATVIRDIYCGQMKDCFNVGEAPRRNSGGGGGLLKPKLSSPLLNIQASASSSQLPAQPPPTGPSAAVNGLYGRPVESRMNIPSNQNPVPPPPADPRTQWEIDAETTRLRKQAEAERRVEEQRRKEREKADATEAKRMQKIYEVEEKERRRKQAEIDKETARLRKQYGDQSGLMPPAKPPLPERHSAPGVFQQMNPSGWFSAPQGPPPQQLQQQQPPPLPLRPTYSQPHQYPQPRPHSTMYLQPSYPQPCKNNAASQSSFFFGAPQPQQPAMKPKRSFWGLRAPEEQPRTLQRRRSGMF